MRIIIYTVFLTAVLHLGTKAQIGFGTTTPNSSLDVRGGFAVNLRSVTSSTTLTSTDYTLVFNGSSAATVTLPDASNCAGRVYWVKNASAILPTPLLTVNPSGPQTIEGLGSWVIDEANEVVRFVSNGSNWIVNLLNTPVRKTTSVGAGWSQGGNRLPSIKNLGTITSNDLQFITNNTARMRLNTSGYLAVGAISPSARLHVVNENDDAGNNYLFEDNGSGINQGLFIRKARGTIAAPQNLQNGDLIAQMRFSGRNNGGFTRAGGSGIDAYYLGTSTNNLSDMRLFSSNTQQLLINESGNVAIGTSTFSANAEKLVVDAGNTSSYNVISGKGDIDNYLQLNIQNRSSGSVASTDVVATADNGDETQNYIDMGINSSGYSSTLIPILDGPSEAYLYSIAADLVVGNGSPGYDVAFFTNGYAGTNERMRISSTGNVGIGVLATPAEKLTVEGIVTPSVNGSFTLGTNPTRWASVWAANGTIQTSDARLKKNIEILNYGLPELMSMRPVSYHWKDQPKGARKVGLIAQEVRRLVPEVVNGNEATEKLGLNYQELVAVLINSLKEQQQRLAQLTLELEQLEKDLK